MREEDEAAKAEKAEKKRLLAKLHHQDIMEKDRAKNMKDCEVKQTAEY